MPSCFSQSHTGAFARFVQVAKSEKPLLKVLLQAFGLQCIAWPMENCIDFGQKCMQFLVKINIIFGQNSSLI